MHQQKLSTLSTKVQRCFLSPKPLFDYPVCWKEWKTAHECYLEMNCVQTYNQTKHDHEITLERQTVIEPCDEDPEAADIPDVLYNVSPMSSSAKTVNGTI